MVFFAVGKRRDAHDASEGRAKVIARGKSGVKGDLLDTVVCKSQKTSGKAHALLKDYAMKRLTGLFLYERREVDRVIAEYLRHLIVIFYICNVSANVKNDLFYQLYTHVA